MMSKEKQIEEKDKRAYDCDECEHFRVCYKIHQYHVHQINTGLYCPSFKRKQSEGEWVEKNVFFAIYKCSICGEENLYKDGHACLSKFCPNCGAKMKGGE